MIRSLVVMAATNYKVAMADDYLDAGLGIGDELYGNAGNDTLIGSPQGSETDPNFNDACVLVTHRWR